MKSTVVNNITLKGKDYSYEITYKDNKNIYFRVKEDLIIHITCSKKVSKGYIENLLQNNADSIINMYNKALEKNKNSSELYYLGNKLILVKHLNKPYINGDYIYAKTLDDAKKYIYSLAYDIFKERIDRIIINFKNLPDFTLKVRHMTSKWGVNNQGSMTITLNTELIKKDVHLIDYVIIHELCHFYEPNHSARFWAWVEKYYPYYKEARKELNS